MSQPTTSTVLQTYYATLDAPPPYTLSSNDALMESSAPSSIVSLPSTRSASPAPPAVSDLKVSGVYQEAERPEVADAFDADAELSEYAEPPQKNEIVLPSDIQRAKAPLLIKQKNSSVTGNFLIFKADSSDVSAPDIKLQTKNSRISSAVYVDVNELNRPVTIEAVTKNSSIALAVHTLYVGQAVDIVATTKNSNANVFLPLDFKGLLILSTSHGKITLSSDLQKVSVRISNPDLETSNVNDSVLRTLSKSLMEEMNDTHSAWYEINGGCGPSRAIIKSENAKISAGFIGDENRSNNEGTCLAM